MEFVNCHVPGWFTVSEIVIQLVFVIVTALIAYYAYNVYRVTGKSNSKLYSLGFLGLAIGYLMQALLNLFIAGGVSSQDILALATSNMASTTLQLSAIPTIVGMIATLAGVATLAYVTLKEKNRQILALFILLSLTSILTPAYPLLYHLTTSIFLGFITLQYYKHHVKKQTPNSLMVYLGFGFVLLGTLQLAVADFMDVFYIIGQFISLIGYLLLLWSLLRVVGK